MNKIYVSVFSMAYKKCKNNGIEDEQRNCTVIVSATMPEFIFYQRDVM